jgi:hypothetical protein
MPGVTEDRQQILIIEHYRQNLSKNYMRIYNGSARTGKEVVKLHHAIPKRGCHNRSEPFLLSQHAWLAVINDGAIKL